MNNPEYWIQHLKLIPHPEGGFYKEVYKSSIEISNNNLPIGYKSARRLATSIYYLLRSNEISRLHRLQSDEIWYFHTGSPIRIIQIDPEGNKHSQILGGNPERAEAFSAIIPGGNIFCAEVMEKDGFSLVSCLVAPGFEFEDFEMFEKEDLLQAYPHLNGLIEKFG